MTRQEALDRLAAHRDDLRRHGIAELALFGSVARDEGGAASDVDLLVSFSRPVGLFEYSRTRRYLESLLGAPVDLVTEAALKPQLRERIHAEAVRV